MSFSIMLEILKKKENKKIVFVQCGHFYLATEGDAVFLNKTLGLRCTCFKNQICKVGVPVNSINKYLEVLDKLGYAYTIYDYDKDNKELIKSNYREGKSHCITDKNLNCLLCKGISMYKDDEYLEAVTKLWGKENCHNYTFNEGKYNEKE